MSTPVPGPVYEFFDFRLDCGRFELFRNGRTLRVERKPMDLLILLVSREGQLVTRAEIAERLWSNEVFVDTEHGINTAIRKLRYLLRDDPDDPRFIQTVTGMGYRFVAPISVVKLSLTETLPEATAAALPIHRKALGWYMAAGICVLVALGVAAFDHSRQPPLAVKFTQLTDFTDSAAAPALSPDGRMVAFIRGGDGFLTSDQIYVKMLPNGEARRVTDDDRPKYGLAFSPDGSEIAYTVLETREFSTYKVSVLGGEPQLLMKNAAGLVWLDPEHLLFSETRSGIHMGVVTATASRTGLREIYFPAHERGMAHYSFPSPDRRWAIVVEMNGNGEWAPCRLIPLESNIAPKLVGPKGACTSAGWSPDGRWMYFTAAVQGQSHIWRQRFPDGRPQQITFGPLEENGVAVEPGGTALITSAGVHESAIWIHDGGGERQLSSEGEVVGMPSPPAFSPDSGTLYYLLRRENSGAELWRTIVDSGRSEAVFPGVSILAFDLSPDGKQVVYTTAASSGLTQLWLAPVDRSSPAMKVGISGAMSPHFGVRGQILFLKSEGDKNYLEQVKPDGTHYSKVFAYPALEFQSVSPNRRWIVAVIAQASAKDLPGVVAIPSEGGTPRRLCVGYCFPGWSTNGKFLFVSVEEPSRMSAGRTLAIPIGAGENLAAIPPGGITSLTEPSMIPGAQLIPRGNLVPGKDPGLYAWVNTTAHRNLYQISLH